jgi:hypothetical protein
MSRQRAGPRKGEAFESRLGWHEHRKQQAQVGPVPFLSRP